jgi:hypothetical protein
MIACRYPYRHHSTILVRLSTASRCNYVFCNNEDLWKSSHDAGAPLFGGTFVECAGLCSASKMPVAAIEM